MILSLRGMGTTSDGAALSFSTSSPSGTARAASWVRVLQGTTVMFCRFSMFQRSSYGLRSSALALRTLPRLSTTRYELDSLW